MQAIPATQRKERKERGKQGALIAEAGFTCHTERRKKKREVKKVL
jgi:hypothetical protein